MGVVKKRMKKGLVLLLAALLLFGSVQLQAFAANSYTINGVKVSVNSYSSSPNECWWYANHLYKKIWGHYFTNQFSDSENSLRNLKDSQLTLTPEHLKAYVLNAPAGAVLRVCDKSYLHANDGKGHSQIIVQSDSKGFTVLEGGLSNSPYKREYYYTWSEYCNSRWPGKYSYIKYIKWPEAGTYKEPKMTVKGSSVANSSAVQISWKTYWDYDAKYVIQRSESATGSWQTVKVITDGSCLAWTDTTVSPGKQYYYKVTAFNSSGESAKESDVVAVLSRSSLNAVSTSSDKPSIGLSWVKTTGYDSQYWIYRSTSAKGPWNCIQKTNSKSLSWADTSIESGKTYYYKVVPYNAKGAAGPESLLASGEAYQLSAVPYDGTVTRLCGADRYSTSYQIADQLKAELGFARFEAVVIATGNQFADALSGSYLAYEKQAPILLSDGGKDAERVKSYLEQNLTEGGTVYILGGNAAVSGAMEKALSAYNVVRLAGEDRLETNLEILKACEAPVTELIICTGSNYADSLSASVAKRPLLLVGETLSDRQKAYLEEKQIENYYIIGGTRAVSAKIDESLLTYGTVERVEGASRYETSVAVAKAFVPDPQTAVVVYGRNFPDGLCGGLLAAAMDGVLLLTEQDVYKPAKNYIAEQGIKKGVILGGSAAVSDLNARLVFHMHANDTIKVK